MKSTYTAEGAAEYDSLGKLLSAKLGPKQKKPEAREEDGDWVDSRKTPCLYLSSKNAITGRRETGTGKDAAQAYIVKKSDYRS